MFQAYSPSYSNWEIDSIMSFLELPKSADLADVLSQLLKERRCRNPNYSMRAFARFLQLAPSTLSEILNRKYQASPSTIERICSRLAIPSDIQCQLIDASRQFRENMETTFEINPNQVDTINHLIKLICKLAGDHPSKPKEHNMLLVYRFTNRDQ